LPGDVCNFPIPEQQFTHVLHAAAPTNAAAAGRPHQLVRTLVDGTRQMLDLGRRSKTKHFLYVSSGAVYGPQPDNMSRISETYQGGPAWLDPRAAYAEGKRVAEQMCSIESQVSDVEFTIARCFTFVGAHLPLDRHFAIGNFIADALAGRAIAVRGNGSPIRSYLYAADLAIWLWTMLLRDKSAPCNLGVFNVGSGQAISIADLAREVAAELNPALEVDVALKPASNAPSQLYVPDVQKADVELGLRQTIGLRQAIRRTAEWYLP
jgi:dTDP-glucose 4,6-dehydratase